ncbi:MAG: hypothetical protein ABIC91_06440 [Nanoarchaeota archaeon]|nr:hypothetical protein [Nanoarchaeota archaeon]MBU1030700.1 hypothetical protein [Nanoarchaeota archaeon]MBU1849565.1 hypothetical protein [Nanoarchaeota archaeon]
MYEKESTKSSDFSSSQYIDDIKKVTKQLEILRKKHGISTHELLDQIKKELKTTIPANIFIKDLSALETITKYLHENKQISLQKIAILTNRTKQNIYTTYKKANKKSSKRLVETSSKYHIPIDVLANKKFSVLESIVKYLREEIELSFEQISFLLKRKYGTIWTIYKRTKDESKN